MPRYTGPIVRRDTSLGVHVRALHSALIELLQARLGEPPSPGGAVALRNHIAALQRAYPKELSLNEVDLAQQMAEEDGLETTDDP